jgi:hypothetical protein
VAYVLCDMDALKEFQQAVDTTVPELRKELGSRDYLIADTIRRIRLAIERGIQRENQASQELDRAEDQLREAERRTAELNRNREPDSEPYETPSFYYEEVSECQSSYDAAERYRQMAEDTLDEFFSYARRYKQEQEDGVEAYGKLAEKSGAFVESYTALLMKAKEATNFGVSAGGGSARSDSGAAAATVAGGDPVKNVMEAGQRWTETLTPRQVTAFEHYSGSGYSNINDTLRGRAPAFEGNNRECARLISGALSKSRIPQDCTVYRGVSRAVLGKYKGMSDSQLVGKMLPDNGFMSTSLKREDAFRDEILLVIDVPAGAPGAYIGYMSLFGHRESEVLFDRGQWLKITSVTRDRDGRMVMHARMLKS